MGGDNWCAPPTPLAERKNEAAAGQFHKFWGKKEVLSHAGFLRATLKKTREINTKKEGRRRRDGVSLGQRNKPDSRGPAVKKKLHVEERGRAEDSLANCDMLKKRSKDREDDWGTPKANWGNAGSHPEPIS